MSPDELLDLLAEVLGVYSGVTLSGLMRETYPQLRFILERQGRVLWPRVAPVVEAAFAPSDDGAKDIVNRYRAGRTLAPGQRLPRTAEEATRDLAWAIIRSRYTGEDPLAAEGQGGRTHGPIQGLSAGAARAVLAWAASADCPPEVFARDVAPLLRGIQATADGGGAGLTGRADR